MDNEENQTPQEQTPGVTEEQQQQPTPAPLTGDVDDLKSQGPAPEQKQVKRTPQHELLVMITNNMFMDAALQNLGYILLGTTIARNEKEFNDPAKFLNVDLTNLPPEDVGRFRLATQWVTDIELDDVSTEFETLIAEMDSALRRMLANNRVVIGTLRVHVVAISSGLQIQLVYIKEV